MAKGERSRTLGHTAGIHLHGRQVYTNSWAVVIGIDAYPESATGLLPLTCAVKDAAAVRQKLHTLGFPPDHIWTLFDGDATKHEIEAVIADELPAKVGRDDRVVVFFAGHGVTETPRKGDKEGYLVPVNYDPGRRYSSCISMRRLREMGQRISAKHVLFLIDACYSGLAVFPGRGLTHPRQIDRLIERDVIQILTAGREDQQALELESEGQGLFTKILLEALDGAADADDWGWVSFNRLATYVQQRVGVESDGRMHPQFGNLDGDGQVVFVFPSSAHLDSDQLPQHHAPAAVVSTGGASDTNVSFRPGRADAAADRVDIEEVLRSLDEAEQFGPDAQVSEALRQLSSEKGRPEAGEARRVPALHTSPDPTVQPSRPEPGDRWVSPIDGQEMVWIPPGEFLMGSPESEKYTFHREKRHRVNIARGYWMDVTPVTNEAYARFVAAHPAWQQGGSAATEGADSGYLNHWIKASGQPWKKDLSYPVTWVSWRAAQAYAAWAGKRLPSEAEWEYAARAGTQTAYWWGDAFDSGRAVNDRAIEPVGARTRVNPWGLADMLGNVWEWTSSQWAAYPYDPHDGREGTYGNTKPVVRGGSWKSSEESLRCACRDCGSPRFCSSNYGFRCAQWFVRS